MKRLCFGTFATVLKNCMAKRVTQKKMCGAMLLSIAPTYDISGDDGTVSDLILGKKNLSLTVTDAAPNANPRAISDYFKQNILMMLDSNKRNLIVLALKDIISSDDDIEPDTVVEILNSMTKEDILKRTAFVLEDFLAGILLYTVLNVENRNCESNVREITDEYIQSFEDKRLDISLIDTYSNLTPEIAYEISIDTHSLVLLAETGGKCQKCGRVLGIKTC